MRRFGWTVAGLIGAAGIFALGAWAGPFFGLPQASPYGGYIEEMILGAAAGDPDAANEAFRECRQTVAVPPGGYPSTFVGPCGGPLLLYVTDELETADPARVKAMLERMEGLHDRDVDGRLPFYRDLARRRVAERCAAAADRPASCSDAAVMAALGVELVPAPVK